MKFIYLPTLFVYVVANPNSAPYEVALAYDSAGCYSGFVGETMFRTNGAPGGKRWTGDSLLQFIEVYCKNDDKNLNTVKHISEKLKMYVLVEASNKSDKRSKMIELDNKVLFNGGHKDSGFVSLLENIVSVELGDDNKIDKIIKYVKSINDQRMKAMAKVYHTGINKNLNLKKYMKSI